MWNVEWIEYYDTKEWFLGRKYLSSAARPRSRTRRRVRYRRRNTIDWVVWRTLVTSKGETATQERKTKLLAPSSRAENHVVPLGTWKTNCCVLRQTIMTKKSRVQKTRRFRWWAAVIGIITIRTNGAVCIPGKVVSGKGVATGQAYRQPTSRPISLSLSLVIYYY